jgi:hypothetical protein
MYAVKARGGNGVCFADRDGNLMNPRDDGLSGTDAAG